eukprot:scaffold2340_cov64-Cyclotella_meneghiniana.AAC.5
MLLIQRVLIIRQENSYHFLNFNNFLPTLSPTASPTKSPSSSRSSSPSVSPTGNCYPTASKIRLTSTTGEFLHFFEFVATDSSDADLTTHFQIWLRENV